MLLVMLLAVAAAPNPASITAPRHAFSTCIRQFETKSVADKIAAPAYAEAIKSACETEAQALSKVLIAYDVAMGGKRATAAGNAASDVADYRDSSAERFKDAVGSSSQ